MDSISEYYELPEPSSGILTIRDYENLIEENDFLYKHFSGESCHIDNNNENELKRKVSVLQRERDEAMWHLDETRKSKSYRIGRAITLLPRNIRRLISK